MDYRTAKLLKESNRIGVSFLITDLKMTQALLDVADTTFSEDTCQRKRQQARNGYLAVLRHMHRVLPSLEQKLEIDQRLDVIKVRLANAGVDFAEDPAPGAFDYSAS